MPHFGMERNATPRDASPTTEALNRRDIPELDPADFERARRGLIAQIPGGRIDTDRGVVWDMGRYDFIQPDSPNPSTVHPSLWRQAQLNSIHGLFEVGPGIWQARGYDISNVTFIAGETGWIIIDPLTAEPCARACLELANEQLGRRRVVAVIYTHSHSDHFGGVHGVTSPEEVNAGRCQIIAPLGFMHETMSENVIAGPAMVRRAHYQFGVLLPPGPRGHVDCGLGKAIPFWVPGLIAPTVEISETGTEMVIDGVRVIFQLTPEAEAPAEMNFFFPDHGWLCMAENCTHNMHNLIPIRGAQVRNALDWSKYIDEAMQLFGDDTELMFASHHWPRWGHDDVKAFLSLQRDLYRWIHDQTMRFANHGLTPTEIAEHLELPPEFRAEAHTTGYYGHLVHNVKAVYQRYLSWYDGNPVNLWRLPPSEAGTRYVEVIGGPDRLVEEARRAAEAGDYRWAAELLNHLIFAQPGHAPARALQADVLEQLGYQSESATFRNAYLTAAQELRNGTMPGQPIRRSGYLDAMSTDQLFESLAVRLRAETLAGVEWAFELALTDLAERWMIQISNRTLLTRPLSDSVETGLPRCELDRVTLNQLTSGTLEAKAALEQGLIAGQSEFIVELLGLLDEFMTNFALVEP